MEHGQSREAEKATHTLALRSFVNAQQTENSHSLRRDRVALVIDVASGVASIPPQAKNQTTGQPAKDRRFAGR
jgi:hypothetical protein